MRKKKDIGGNKKVLTQNKSAERIWFYNVFVCPQFILSRFFFTVCIFLVIGYEDRVVIWKDGRFVLFLFFMYMYNRERKIMIDLFGFGWIFFFIFFFSLVPVFGCFRVFLDVVLVFMNYVA